MGFTLIELLVVIAIIAILAAILFPTFAMMKERGRQVRCLNNQKHLAGGFILYCDDYSGRLPFIRIGATRVDCRNWCGSVGVGRWCYPEKGQIFRYVKNSGVFLCPTDSTLPATAIIASEIPAGLTNKSFALSYSANCRLDWPADTPMLISSVRRTKQVFLLIHENHTRINDGDLNWWDNIWDLPSGVHYSGTTLAYVDGHCLWQSYDQLKNARNQGLWSPTETPTPPPTLLP